MKPSTNDTVADYQDMFIREVRVNYVATTEKPFAIKDAGDVADFVRSKLSDNSREHCLALYLNAVHHVVSYSIISIGTANRAPLHPREVFQRAIISEATAVIIAHNHPSGESTPIPEDLSITARIREAGKLLSIPLLDHVIVTDHSYLSLN